MEKLRRLLSLPRTDDLNTLAYHQQWLINAGYLVRRDLQLTNSYNVQVFTTSVMMEIGGPHSRVWFATNRALVVIAQPSHIEAFTRWILDHDAKMPTINHAGP